MFQKHFEFIHFISIHFVFTWFALILIYGAIFLIPIVDLVLPFWTMVCERLSAYEPR